MWMPGKVPGLTRAKLAATASRGRRGASQRLSRAVLPGHIGGTSPRDLSITDENRRDLSAGQSAYQIHLPWSPRRLHKTRPTGRLTRSSESRPHTYELEHSMSSFRHHLWVDTPDYYAELADKDLDRTLRTNDASSRAEDIARAQVHALLALASAVDRLAQATEAQG